MSFKINRRANKESELLTYGFSRNDRCFVPNEIIELFLVFLLNFKSDLFLLSVNIDDLPDKANDDDNEEESQLYQIHCKDMNINVNHENTISLKASICPFGKSAFDMQLMTLYITCNDSFMTDNSNNITKFLAYFELYCKQNDSSSVDISSFAVNSKNDKNFAKKSKSKNYKKWWLNDMTVAQAKNSNVSQLDIVCYIEIIEIEYGNALPSFGHSWSKNVEMNSDVNHEWIVRDSLLKQMQTSDDFKCFYAPNLDYGNWSLRCSPNGWSRRQRNSGNLYMFYRLLSLPANVNKITATITTKCVCNDGDALFEFMETRLFSYARNFSWPWPDSTCSTEKIQNLKVKCLRFVINIKITQIYDSDDAVVPSSEWSEYGFR